MIYCDLNCDIGEGMGNDEAIMPHITSANIACGYHAGDESIIRRTLILCQKYNVAIGAHPSFEDRENFGRSEIFSTPQEIYRIVREQVMLLKNMANAFGALLHHVKPHGALYNLASKDIKVARAISEAVRDTDKRLIIYGLSGSCLIHEAILLGLTTASEAFADRSYLDDGNLTPRHMANALLQDENEVINRVIKMVKNGCVTTVSGKSIPVTAQTICIHGDSERALSFIKKIFLALQNEHIALRTIKAAMV